MRGQSLEHWLSGWGSEEEDTLWLLIHNLGSSNLSPC